MVTTTNGIKYVVYPKLPAAKATTPFFRLSGNGLANCLYTYAKAISIAKSGWGAFLGQVPCLFYRKHYGPVLKDQSNEIVENDEILW